MVAIGSCDYCSEFCSALGVNAAENFAFDNGWVPTSARERHVSLVARRLECSIREGYDYVTRHVGPYHYRDGGFLEDCPNCSDNTQMDAGYWDTALDHSRCTSCWGDVAGGVVLDRKRVGHVAAIVDAASHPSADPTAPADRTRAEAALRAYVGELLPTVRWVASPLEVVRALTTAIEEASRLDPDPVSTVAPWSIRAHEAFDAVDDRDTDQPTGDVARARSNAAIVNALAATIRATHADAVGGLSTLLPRALSDAGQFSGPGRSDDPDLARLLDELRDSAGPLVVLAEEIVVSERPTRCTVDELGRPHAEGGPAIVYGDGLAVFAWHGVVVPEWAVGDPDQIVVSDIDRQPNVEVRRVLVERVGPERLIRERGVSLIHEDETGRLWRRGLPAGATRTRGGRHGDEPVAFVEVINSTPDPDGSRRTYFLRVPPAIETAREAVAWTFSMSPAEYRPSMES